MSNIISLMKVLCEVAGQVSSKQSVQKMSADLLGNNLRQYNKNIELKEAI